MKIPKKKNRFKISLSHSIELIMSPKSILFYMFFVCAGVQAQTLNDVMYFNYSYSPDTDFKDIEGQTGDLQIKELQLGIPPIKLGDKLKWMNVLYGRSLAYSFKGMPNEFTPLSNNFSDIRYTPLFNYQFNNPKWFLIAAPMIMLRSDFKNDVSTDDLFVSGLLLLNRKIGSDDKWVFSFGAIMTNDIIKNQINPSIGLTYKSEKLTLELLYPRINVFYKPTKRIEWGMETSIDAAIFRSKNIRLDNGKEALYLRTINVFAGQAFNVRLFSNLWLNTRVGYNFIRYNDLMDTDREVIKDVNLDLKGNLLIKAGVSMRFGN